LPHYSRSFLSKCQIKINSKLAKLSQKIRSGDKIYLAVPSLKEIKIQPEKIPLEIIFEDQAILVLNKPAGMVTHPTDHGGHVTGTLVNALLFHTKFLAQTESIRPGLVHRLDRDTSGIMVVAKTDLAKKKLSDQFAKRKVQKFYTALVWGKLKSMNGRIEAPLARDPIKRMQQKISITNKAREAITEFSVQEEFKQASLLKVKLLTGRTHQIRVHLASLGNPVAGDLIYGFKKVDIKLSPPRMLLHASFLRFEHPETGEVIEFESELPGVFMKFLEELRE
jgi:23S rRNA pseudouridine1911/1915/1917 synthase